MLRRLAAERGPALAAVALGHAMRCLYFRDNECRPAGACKASWLTEVFGVHLRSVKRARTQLIEMGWLTPLRADAWYQNRYGWRGAINLDWGERAETPPPDTQRMPQSPPPLINRNLSARAKNQHRLPPVSNGACKQARETRSRRLPLGRICPRELTTDAGEARLFRLAAKSGCVPDSEAGRQRVAVAIAYAKRKAKRNAVGLFVKLISNPRWEFANSIDERAALNAHAAQPVRVTRPMAARVADILPDLLARSRVVTATRQDSRLCPTTARRGESGDEPFAGGGPRPLRRPLETGIQARCDLERPETRHGDSKPPADRRGVEPASEQAVGTNQQLDRFLRQSGLARATDATRSGHRPTRRA